MKKIHSIYSKGEIDLSELIERLWNKKIMIVLIALISFVIIISYDKNKPKKPNLFENILVINQTKAKEFLNFVSIYNYMNKSKSEENLVTQELKNTKVLDRFVEEFMDYEELITILKKDENIKRNILHLDKYNQQEKLYGYAKLFNIQKSKTETPSYDLKFTWHTNDREIRDILDQTLRLTEMNLRETIFLELENYYRLERDLIINKDLVRIEFLSEQSTIAKELGIIERKVETINDLLLSEDVQERAGNANISFNINSNNRTYPYYVRGYKTINMEISLIKNRRHLVLEKIRKKIDLLKKKEVKWVDYNIFLLDTKLINKNKTLSLSFVILLSLIIGVVCAFISDIFKFHKIAKKKAN